MELVESGEYSQGIVSEVLTSDIDGCIEEDNTTNNLGHLISNIGRSILDIKPLENASENMEFYDESIRISRNKFVNESIRIGYALNEIANSKDYLLCGYKTIYDYANKRFGFCKTTVKNLRNIAKQFCFCRDARVLNLNVEDKYKEYNYSQLVELSYLTPKEREYATPLMSAKEIRKLHVKPTEEPEEENKPINIKLKFNVGDICYWKRANGEYKESKVLSIAIYQDDIYYNVSKGNKGQQGYKAEAILTEFEYKKLMKEKESSIEYENVDIDGTEE